MKSLISFFTAFIIITSCSNKKKAGEIISNDGKEKTTINLQEAVESGDEQKKKLEELKKLTPYTPDELKGFLPEEILGMIRTNHEASSMGGYAAADATYRKEQNDKPYISISLVDCAGERGSGYYSYGYWTKMNLSKESDDGYTKTVDWNGQRVIETYDKSSDRYELTYFTSDRFLVTIKGGKTGLDLVKQAAQSLNLKTN